MRILSLATCSPTALFPDSPHLPMICLPPHKTPPPKKKRATADTPHSAHRRHCDHTAPPPFSSLYVGLHTILPLPIVCVEWQNKGGGGELCCSILIAKYMGGGRR